jgi:hypothetical protein
MKHQKEHSFVNNLLLSMRRCLGICIAVLMIAGCGGSQIPTVSPAAVSQSLGSTNIVPMLAVCPDPGKTYARSDGNGQVSIVFQQAYAKAGPYDMRIRTRITYTHWPENRPLIYNSLNPRMGTCGPESGKSPVGTVKVVGINFSSVCVNGDCTYTDTMDMSYKPPATLPGGKKWKFDFIRFDTKKPLKGFAPLPSYRIIVTR